MRRLVMTVSEVDGGSFTETYLEGERGSFPLGHADPERWGRECVEHWNATLRPQDRVRTVVDTRIEDVENEKTVQVEHAWRKTNLVTLTSPRGVYDMSKCERCGITGKRYGLNQHVTLDSRYRAAAFRTCNGARALLEKRKGKA